MPVGYADKRGDCKASRSPHSPLTVSTASQQQCSTSASDSSSVPATMTDLILSRSGNVDVDGDAVSPAPASAMHISAVGEGAHRRHEGSIRDNGRSSRDCFREIRGGVAPQSRTGISNEASTARPNRKLSRKRPRQGEGEAGAKIDVGVDGRGDDDTLATTPSLRSTTTDRHLEEGRTAPPSPIDPTKQASMSDDDGSLSVVAWQGRPFYCRRPRNGMSGYDDAADNGNGASKAHASPPPSTSGPSSNARTRSAHSPDPLILFGLDLSSQSPSVQFLLCACGVFAFTIVYGYLQELLAVHIAGRKFGLFLATCQFAGYAFWSFVLTKMRAYRQEGDAPAVAGGHSGGRVQAHGGCTIGPSSVPLRAYVGLSLIRAVDLGMTNLAMQFLNYPAKTLIKSSRVVFTMLLGLVIGRKQYRCRDYLAVLLLVAGLGIFLHADSRSKTVFHPLGVAMLVISLTCDGTLNNWSEVIMREYKVGQDEFQLQLYAIAFMAMATATYAKGELVEGARHFFLESGTVPEIESSDTVVTWTPRRKILVLFFFSTTGLLGSSCAGAITKRFGALSMSITSTARKAMTLFLSFVAFHNTCTFEHIAGMVIFLGALLLKSLCAKAGLDRAAAQAGNAPRQSFCDGVELHIY